MSLLYLELETEGPDEGVEDLQMKAGRNFGQGLSLFERQRGAFFQHEQIFCFAQLDRNIPAAVAEVARKPCRNGKCNSAGVCAGSAQQPVRIGTGVSLARSTTTSRAAQQSPPLPCD